MKFEIYRTSDEHKQPVPEAVLETTERNGYTTKRWVIEVESLPALVSLMEREGHDIIITQGITLPSLEIYDDWRE